MCYYWRPDRANHRDQPVLGVRRSASELRTTWNPRTCVVHAPVPGTRQPLRDGYTAVGGSTSVNGTGKDAFFANMYVDGDVHSRWQVRDHMAFRRPRSGHVSPRASARTRTDTLASTQALPLCLNCSERGPAERPAIQRTARRISVHSFGLVTSVWLYTSMLRRQPGRELRRDGGCNASRGTRTPPLIERITRRTAQCIRIARDSVPMHAHTGPLYVSEK